MQLSQNLSMMKVAGAMQKSAQVMAMMNNLIRLPQLNKVMMVMAREMEKAGLIEEILEDAVPDDDELDEAADEEVDKVLEELTIGLKSANVATDALSSKGSKEENMDDLETRLGALKG